MSRLISTFRCHPNDTDSSPASALAFDDAQQGILAVASTNGGVSLYDCSSDRLFSAPSFDSSACGRANPAVQVPTRTDASCVVVSLAWMPGELTLAMGMEDGNVSLWSVTKNNGKSSPLSSSGSNQLQVKILSSNKTSHSSPVILLDWSADGTRFVSGDKAGNVTLWEVQPKGKVLAKSWYKKESPVTDVIWCCFNGGQSCISIFAFGFEDGLVCAAGTSSREGCTELHNFRSPIERMMFYEEKRRIIIFTESLEMAQFFVTDDGSFSLRSRVKLSIPGQKFNGKNLAWIDKGFVICASGEKFLRVWDLNNNETGILPLPHDDANPSMPITASLVSFNNKNGSLMAVSSQGMLMRWKSAPVCCDNDATDTSSNVESASTLKWDLCYAEQELCQRMVQSITISPRSGILATNCDDGVYLLREKLPLHTYNEGTAAIQVEQNLVLVDHSALLSVQPQLAIKGMACDARHLVIWSGNEIQVYRMFDSRIELLSEMQLQSRSISMYKDSLYIASGNKLLITSLMGVQRLSVFFPEGEGEPMLMNLCCSILAVVTKTGTLKLFDVSKKEPSLLHKPQNLYKCVRNDDCFGEIISVKCNATGSLVSILVSNNNNGDTYVYVYNISRQSLTELHCGNVSTPFSNHFWDSAETRLLAVEANSIPSEAMQVNNEVILFFVDEDDGGVYVHERIAISDPSSVLIGVDIPHVVLGQTSSKADCTKVDSHIVANHVMKDFRGLEEESPLVMAAMIDFSFYLRIDNVDKAFDAIQTITSPNVWGNLAPICINMMRLDLVELCLSKMKHTRGVAAVRHAKSEPEIQVALAAAAIELGLYHSAETLYIECHRYDHLNYLYQIQGKWEQALKIAEDKDRLHLDLTRYRFAKHLEEIGCVELAEERFGKFLNARQSPQFIRYMKEKRLDPEMDNYVLQKDDKQLVKWYGSYCESTGNISKATDYYLLAGDDLSLVKIACGSGNFERALEIVEESGNAAAAYYLAKFSKGPEAIRLYSLGGMYHQAIRIAISQGDCDMELLEIAQRCRPPQVFECAKYFERKGMRDHACALYRRCGQKPKALSMCLSVLDTSGKDNNEMNELLVSLTGDLKGNLSNNVAHRVVNKLDQIDESALMIQVICSNFDNVGERLGMCFERNVILTDEIVDQILTGEASNEHFRLIAAKCGEQGNQRLACKIYTMMGERKLAVKCLLKDGDTKAIISYASLSKDKEIYVLVGNYLQKLNLSSDPKIRNAIIQFYSEARKHDRLVSFFLSQAQTSVEEYGRYTECETMLKEALFHSAKIESDGSAEIQLLLKKRLSTVERFIRVRDSLDSIDRLSLEKVCSDLLSQGESSMVRDGDCYALLVQYYAMSKDYATAFKHLMEMQENSVEPHKFIDKSIIDAVVRSEGKDLVHEDGSMTDQSDLDESVDES